MDSRTTTTPIAKLDAPAAQLPQDWAVWMLREVREADVVLVVASAAYKRRAEGDADPGEGSGAQWEAALLRDAFYADQAAGRLKYVPVLLAGQTSDQIPAWLSPHAATYYRIPDLTLTAAEPLIRYLTGQPAITEPPLGPRPQLPPRH